MSATAARVEAPFASGATPAEQAESRPDDLTSFLLRLATFIALAAFALGHWVGVITGPPLGRTVGLLAVCGAAGVGLWATRDLPLWPGRAARVLIVFALAVLALMVTGLHVHYLKPARWDNLGNGLHHGLLLAQSAIYPYDGRDQWLRLTLMLAGPAFLVPATALAFWPGKSQGMRRGVALVILIGLFGLALAERAPSSQIGRGFALLLLIAAWLWLPRLNTKDMGAAAVAVIAAAVLALPVAAGLDGSGSWIDYRHWHVLSNSRGVGFQWNHSYGPIDWPRRGTTLLYVKADRPYYWKAEVLDSFNGRTWLRTGANASVSASSELPIYENPKWVKKIHVDVAALRGDLVVGAGTPRLVAGGAGDATLNGDGTVLALDHPLRDGESYDITTYLPQPSPQEMRKATPNYEGYFGMYTKLFLPAPGAGPTGREMIDPGLWGNPVTGDPVAPKLIESSPYAGMYRLANRLTAGDTEVYAAVKHIQDYLLSARFAYDEHPALRRYPLESFVMKDRIGYCQQFSGAMALMLRMKGIPARVVSGFAPGSPLPDVPGVYRVRDYDAHSWVEVYFSGIGWVTFDPTPSASPASSQSDDRFGAAGGRGPTPRGLGQVQGNDPVVSGGSLGLAADRSSAFKWWMVPAGLAAIAALALAGVQLMRARRRRREADPAEVAVDHLRDALLRVGSPVVPGATLSLLEEVLRRRAGPRAANYARLLREHRYGAGHQPLPGRSDRRALRRALARTTSPMGRLRLWRALLF
jgi:transglutaminase-like putative cysteine protease